MSKEALNFPAGKLFLPVGGMDESIQVVDSDITFASVAGAAPFYLGSLSRLFGKKLIDNNYLQSIMGICQAFNSFGQYGYYVQSMQKLYYHLCVAPSNLAINFTPPTTLGTDANNRSLDIYGRNPAGIIAPSNVQSCIFGFPDKPLPPNQVALPPIFWFNPSGISGTNGADITGWTDSGPNGYVPAAIGSSGDRPTVATNSINGHTTAANAGKHGLQIPVSPGISLTSKDTWSLFAIVKWTSFGVAENDFCSLTIALGNGFRAGLDGFGIGQFMLTYPGVGNFTTGNVPTLNVFHCVEITANAGVLSVAVDGILYPLGTHIMAVTTFPTVFNLCQGYDDSTTNYFFQGNLAEIALYNGVLSSNDLTSLLNYSRQYYLTP